MEVEVKKAIVEKCPQLFSTHALQIQSISGGSVNNTYHLSDGRKQFFCKTNSASNFPNLFRREAAGLKTIASHGVIRTPAVIDCFEQGDTQILLLEWIQEGERNNSFWKAFGEQLAALHRISQSSFGFDEDNYMGSVPQQNALHKTWISFFRQQRLEPMVEQCAARGLLKAKHNNLFLKLYNRLPGVFNEEPPSLLHGDLWSGNFMCNAFGEPVLIDPAVYFGHRSVDLAMTTLFGGFDAVFYEAYEYHFPSPDNYKEQWAACNLYPLLIHLYLFGNSYLPQIERTLLRFT